jgi:YggT family protein
LFVIGHFLKGLAMVLDGVLRLYFWIVIISAVLTWVNPDPYNPIVRTLRGLTEPVFWRVRRWLPFVVVGGIDLSPLVVILGVQLLREVIPPSLQKLALEFL